MCSYDVEWITDADVFINSKLINNSKRKTILTRD